MKRTFLLLALIGIFATSCDDGSFFDCFKPKSKEKPKKEEPVNPDDDKEDDEPEQETPVFAFEGDDTVTIGTDGGVVEFIVATNIQYSVEISAEAQSWVTLLDTRAVSIEKLTFEVAINEDAAERSATIRLCDAENNELQLITINQEAAVVDVPVGPDKTYIEFTDSIVKLVCVDSFDANSDGEVSIEEAGLVTSIGENFFGDHASKVTSFDELHYFANVTRIDNNAFDKCSNLESIILPEQVATIGHDAFEYCTSLKSINIPEALTSIESWAFNGCRALESVNISSISTLLNVQFDNATSNPLGYAHNIYLDGKLVTEITVPSDVSQINGYALYGCNCLESVTISSGVKTIGIYAFNGCSGLTSINIPSSVETIGDRAFGACVNLAEVYCACECAPVLGNDAFSYNTGNYVNGGYVYEPYGCTIYVPVASVEAYKSAENWSTYADYIEGYEF